MLVLSDNKVQKQVPFGDDKQEKQSRDVGWSASEEEIDEQANSF